MGHTSAATVGLLGGELCLDFANTVEPRQGEGRRDHLREYVDLVRWAEHAGAVGGEGARRLLRVAEARWDGLGDGFGLLAGRRARLVVAGRGAATQPRHAQVWLPGPDGSVQLIAEPAATADADVVPLRPVTAG